MDYRHFDQDRPVLPQFILRHSRLLKPIGIILCIIGLLIPFLIVIRVIQSTYLLNFIGYVFMLMGPISYLVGFALDGRLNRPN